MTKFKVGDRVIYRGAWNSQPGIETTITGIGEKNDRVVYDTDNEHWGYEDQFDALDTRK